MGVPIKTNFFDIFQTSAGFVFSLYSETFQTSGNDMKVGNILFTLKFIFVDELKTKEKPLELKFACYCMKISGSLYAKSMSFYW